MRVRVALDFHSRRVRRCTILLLSLSYQTQPRRWRREGLDKLPSSVAPCGPRYRLLTRKNSSTNVPSCCRSEFSRLALACNLAVTIPCSVATAARNPSRSPKGFSRYHEPRQMKTATVANSCKTHTALYIDLEDRHLLQNLPPRSSTQITLPATPSAALAPPQPPESPHARNTHAPQSPAT